MYKNRMQQVLKNLNEAGYEQLLISDPRSIQYLTGLYVEPEERFLALLLKSSPHEASAILFLNELFSAAQNMPCKIVGFNDTDEPLDLVVEHCDQTKPLACDKTLRAGFLLPLMERQAAASYVVDLTAVDTARAHKDEAEQHAMRAASKTNDAAMARLVGLIHEGVTEAQVAAQLEDIYRELGAQGFSFNPIVSFGANAADPHHEPDNTVLKEGDVVLFDVGCRQDNYCADMTRSFFFRSAGEEQRKVYEVVRQANEAARNLVKPGVLFSELDKAARQVIEEAGYGEYFTHRLGHQIGLDVHEPGDVSAVHHEPVEAGMIFSIEPGIYLPGRFGVRIEDLALVTEEGCEVLNSYPRDLRIL